MSNLTPADPNMADTQPFDAADINQKIQQILDDVAGTDPADSYRKNEAGLAIEQLIRRVTDEVIGKDQNEHEFRNDNSDAIVGNELRTEQHKKLNSLVGEG